MRIIKITENKKEKLSKHVGKALKEMGRAMQCIEDLDEDDDDDDMGERYDDYYDDDDDMGERDNYGRGGSRYRGGGNYGGGSMGERRRRSRRTGRFM